MSTTNIPSSLNPHQQMENFFSDNGVVDEVESDSPAKSDKGRKGKSAVWRDDIINTFITLMEDELKKGHRTPSTFTASAWREILSVLNEKTKMQYTISQLKTKFNRLRSEFREFCDLKRKTGVTYDPTTGRISTNSKQWNDWKKTTGFSHIDKFRKHGFPYFERLVLLFGDTHATGKHAHPSTQIPSDSTGSDNVHSLAKKSAQATASKGRACSHGSSGSAKRARTADDPSMAAISEAMNKIATSSEKRAEMYGVRAAAYAAQASSQGDSLAVRRTSALDDYNEKMNRSFDVLNAIQDITPDQFMKAAKVLHDDEDWRNVFLRMPPSKQLIWVQHI